MWQHPALRREARFTMPHRLVPLQLIKHACIFCPQIIGAPRKHIGRPNCGFGSLFLRATHLGFMAPGPSPIAPPCPRCCIDCSVFPFDLLIYQLTQPSIVAACWCDGWRCRYCCWRWCSCWSWACRFICAAAAAPGQGDDGVVPAGSRQGLGGCDWADVVVAAAAAAAVDVCAVRCST